MPENFHVYPMQNPDPKIYLGLPAPKLGISTSPKKNDKILTIHMPSFMMMIFFYEIELKLGFIEVILTKKPPKVTATVSWLVVEPTHPENISQNGNLPQTGMKMKKIETTP